MSDQMTLNDYQDQTAHTKVYDHPIYYPVYGLVEEAGEVAGQIKRSLRDDGGQLTPARREKLLLELGDVLWYVAALAADLGFSLEQVATTNLKKLADRKDRNQIKGEGSER